MAIHDLTGDPRRTGAAVLRSRIKAAHVPPPRPHDLRLATWNIRRFGEGRRTDDSIAMIAAILRQFDLVAMVELCDDTRDLERTLRVLGSDFGVVFSDYLRDDAGNRERIGFVFDERRVRFTGLASNAEGTRRLARGRYVEAVPWWRPPFLASFRSGGFHSCSSQRTSVGVTRRRRGVRSWRRWETGSWLTDVFRRPTYKACRRLSEEQRRA